MTGPEFLERRGIWLILVCALFLFSAAAGLVSLPSLDDCFYARKAVEMERSGAFFSVTWWDDPAFQNPPLQLWLIARSFSIFGQNDFAARLPAILMAAGILLMTYRIGRLTVGPSAALAGASVLLLTPIFVDNARRCMMEIPLAFWTAAGVLILLESRRRPRLGLLFSIPLGAAILTKSLLGLLPLLILLAGVFTPALAACRRNGWLLAGVLLGILCGSSWTLHLAAVHGMEGVRAHYWGEILTRSSHPFSLTAVLTEYPGILLLKYQPLILPAVAGLVLFFRRRHTEAQCPTDLLVLWIVLPLALYAFSSARSSRYIFPLLPALALAAGAFFHTKLPRLVAPLAAIVAPACCLLIGGVYWLSPSLLIKNLNAPYKQHAATARSEFPEGASMPYWGERYWSAANPMAYYWEIRLTGSAPSPAEAVQSALLTPHRSLMCDRPRLPQIQAIGAPFRIVAEGRDWAWLRFVSERGAPPPTPAPRTPADRAPVEQERKPER